MSFVGLGVRMKGALKPLIYKFGVEDAGVFEMAESYCFKLTKQS